MIDKKLTSNLHTIILNEYENTEGIVILEAGQIVFEESSVTQIARVRSISHQ